MIKSSNEELKTEVKEINDIIVKINNKNIDINRKINTNNTERIFKDDELKREIDDVVKTVALEFTKIQLKFRIQKL